MSTCICVINVSKGEKAFVIKNMFLFQKKKTFAEYVNLKIVYIFFLWNMSAHVRDADVYIR